MSGSVFDSDAEFDATTGGASFFGVVDPAAFFAGDADGILRGLAADTADMAVRV